MKVLMLNGSCNLKGSTFLALEEIGKCLKTYNINYEIFQIGPKPVRDCIGCGKCAELKKCIFNDDEVNNFVQKANEADGFIFASPVYYAHASGRLLSFLDRAFYSASCSNKSIAFKYKPSSAVAVARRAGTTSTLADIEKYFTINQMPIISSSYWNMVYSRKPQDIPFDEEGLQTMRNIAHNMAWILNCIDLGKKNNIPYPKTETGKMTNFIKS